MAKLVLNHLVGGCGEVHRTQVNVFLTEIQIIEWIIFSDCLLVNLAERHRPLGFLTLNPEKAVVHLSVRGKSSDQLWLKGEKTLLAKR